MTAFLCWLIRFLPALRHWLQASVFGGINAYLKRMV
ncbi:hypothetical protein PFWH6_1184 [Pseudomonas fluorescens WH6]|nr:hypothetical protein PFWH6_1184 [Pseudomonas fluorescens WH6]